jgi:hypothetical protein
MIILPLTTVLDNKEFRDFFCRYYVPVNAKRLCEVQFEQIKDTKIANFLTLTSSSKTE